MDRIEIRLFPTAGKSKNDTSYSGFLQVGDSFRLLPLGSTLDTKDGVFFWLIHPVFHGEYELVFTENEAGRPVAKETIRVKIGERSEDLEGSPGKLSQRKPFQPSGKQRGPGLEQQPKLCPTRCSGQRRL
jgi:hypothetical protein